MKIKANTKLEKPPRQRVPIDFYAAAFHSRLNSLNDDQSFRPTVVSEFTAGYEAALWAVKNHGLERVLSNSTSGLAK